MGKKHIRTWFFLDSVTVIMCSWWASGYDAHSDSERLGFDSPLRHTEFFLVANHHLFYPLLQNIGKYSIEPILEKQFK